ncbi:hypothetical protein DAPPUDRAFT_110812 [Daphnia pulex]|uniref:Uncharacterized protein n=1 Tax=Daphnia pulex TaxID=6669 RepID=E9H782_DAPPU|nr:hypothetical protein DAPPUDRAFT_110812 [Daphnia pulex]|eukprot:EFX72415.1 hypothetical protein DAPPUDRAFT_110812 [Daphnia pulex]
MCKIFYKFMNEINHEKKVVWSCGPSSVVTILVSQTENVTGGNRYRMRVEIQAKLCCYVLPVELGCADLSKTELRLCCSQQTGGRQQTRYQNRKQAFQLVADNSSTKSHNLTIDGCDGCDA